jgi:hypothetical protein
MTNTSRIEQAPHMQCAVCNRGLTPLDPGAPFPIRYLHAVLADEDHAPVPIPLNDQVVMKCDFCCEDTETIYTLHASPFLEHKKPGVTWAGYLDDGDWASCLTCRELIRAGAWEQLALRSERSLLDEVVRSGLARAKAARGIRNMHQAFRENWDGRIPEEPD